MSHRDHGSRNRRQSNHQALRQALDWLLASADFSHVSFREDSTWTPKGLIVTALLWAWSDEKGLKERFVAARKIGLLAWSWERVPATTYQAFMKMLRKWTIHLAGILMVLFRERMQTALRSRFLVAGRAVFGVDGSRLLVARTQSNEARFAPGKNRETYRQKKRRRARQRSARGRSGIYGRPRDKRADRAQIWLTTMWHVGTGLPWDWRLGPSDSSERDHFREMIDSLPMWALVAADAGFIGYVYWRLMLDSQRDFIIRVGANVRLLKRLGWVKCRDNTVYFWPDSAARKKQPPLVLRLVVVHNGRHPVYLVTSIVKVSELTDKRVVEIYRQRWGIELFYRHFKQTFERRKLRSHSADNALVEAQWSLLGLWAMNLHAEFELARHHVPTGRISIAGVLRAYRHPMREYKSHPDPGEDLKSLLRRAVIDGYHRASKASREHPHPNQERPCGPPDIRSATPKQIRAARNLKRILEKGLTA